MACKRQVAGGAVDDLASHPAGIRIVEADLITCASAAGIELVEGGAAQVDQGIILVEDRTGTPGGQVITAFGFAQGKDRGRQRIGWGSRIMEALQPVGPGAN